MGTLVLKAGHRITIGGKPALVSSISNNGLVAYLRYQDGWMEKIVLQTIPTKDVSRVARRKRIREQFKVALRARR